MSAPPRPTQADANIRLYPWFRFFQNLVFWQAVWFLFFQSRLSAAEAILLYVVYDVATTALEVPSGYMSDRLGRRVTLVLSALAGLGGAVLLSLGEGFGAFALAQILLGAAGAFASGTDSALLYESLNDEGRRGEVERQELRAWRFSFTALAMSAIAGGALSLAGERLPFIAGVVAAAVLLALTLRFCEPPGATVGPGRVSGRLHLEGLRAALTEPVLIWFFWLAVLMYVFSHVPYVFGQPFILEALRTVGLEGDAPVVSGAVSSSMMLISVTVSLVAFRLRRRLGLAALLLLAFAMQIGLSAALSVSGQAAAILILFLRMVPDSLSKPFILASIQPRLLDGSRATYLSLQSLCARLTFAGTLLLASRSASTGGEMDLAEIQQILGGYVLAGILCLGVLALAARYLKIDPGAR